MRNNNLNNSLSTNVEVPVRLRRAINLNDLVLVKRIIRNNPNKIKNPDLGDNGNTSLHLAAKLGFLEIAVSGHVNISSTYWILNDRSIFLSISVTKMTL